MAMKIRDEISQDVIGNRVVRVCQARSGGLLIDVRGNAAEFEAVRAEVSRSASEGINVRALGRRELLEIRDLDEWMTKEEVAAVVGTCTGDTADEGGESEEEVRLVTGGACFGHVRGCEKYHGQQTFASGNDQLQSQTQRDQDALLQVPRIWVRVQVMHDRRDCCRKCGESGQLRVVNGGGENVRGANRARWYILGGGPAWRDSHRIIPMIKILQINVDGGRVAQYLTEAKSKELGIDVLVVCEQYRNGTEENGWFRDGSGKSAVAVLSQDVPMELIGPPEDTGFRGVMVKGKRIYSCYWSPIASSESFAGLLDHLEISVRSMEAPVIIAGDFNAKAAEWGDHREDDRGRLVMELMSSLKIAKNRGGTPTFERVFRDGRVAQSDIIITLVSESISQQVLGWYVLEDYIGSLHRFIMYNIVDRADKTTNHRDGSK